MTGPPAAIFKMRRELGTSDIFTSRSLFFKIFLILKQIIHKIKNKYVAWQLLEVVKLLYEIKGMPEVDA